MIDERVLQKLTTALTKRPACILHKSRFHKTSDLNKVITPGRLSMKCGGTNCGKGMLETMMTVAATETRNNQTIIVADHAMNDKPFMISFVLIVPSSSNFQQPNLNCLKMNLTLTWHPQQLLWRAESTTNKKANTVTKHFLIQGQQMTLQPGMRFQTIASVFNIFNAMCSKCVSL